ncbi:MAG: DUF4147 domain-containing protein [Patescibacteria group bacterium]
MKWIQNYNALNSTPSRYKILSIAEAALEAINTDSIVRSRLKYENGSLIVDGKKYNLSSYKNIKLLGFGKASSKAVKAIEDILGDRISGGIAIDTHPEASQIVRVEQGDHPLPSEKNITASNSLVKLAQESTEEDLVLVVVSGGGSALLCWPFLECRQGVNLYKDSERVGMNILEMNIVRKHMSQVKGGGLAAILHPATVIGLIFCDVPGGAFEEVASGPTYYDFSTVADAQKILDSYGLTGYVLNETLKNKSIFDKVHNVKMISNATALKAMSEVAESFGFKVKILGDAVYDPPKKLIERLITLAKPGTVILAGGETRFKITKNGGTGGRCQMLALEALKYLKPGHVLLSLASDGIDNSDAAGVIADKRTIDKSRELNLNLESYLENFRAYEVFEATGDLIFTGPTGANVSDLYILLNEHE